MPAALRASRPEGGFCASSPLRRLLSTLPLAAALLLLAACSSPSARLATHENERADAYLAAARRSLALEPAPLSFADALASLRARNLELRAAREAVVTAEEGVRQVYKDLLPGANLSANLSRSLTDLANLSQSDLSYSVFAYINFPGLIQLRLRDYAARLSLIRARWSYELKERELTVQLRETFLRADLLATRRRSLLASLQWEPDRKSVV